MIDSKITPRTLLVCIDASNASEVALRLACSKARKNGFSLQILSVLEASYKNLMFGSRQIEEEKREELENNITKLVNKICVDFAIIPSISVRQGDIAREIVHEIKSNKDVRMVILGKSDNSQSDNTVLPRIAKEIGNKIHIPVLIVPENLSADYLMSF